MTARRVLLVLLVLLSAAPAAAVAHKGNINFLSEIEGLQPAIDGVRLEMINRDDRILLENRSDQDILIMGYEKEPYARLKADGTVEVNTNSKAYYLNEDRFAAVDVPKTLPSEPAWKQVSQSHRFEWHDHRAHWMGKDRPPQVTDPEARTKVFDWNVPVKAGGRTAAITGQLFWTPRPNGGPPAAAIGGLALLVVLLGVGVVVVRRRRGTATEEAW